MFANFGSQAGSFEFPQLINTVSGTIPIPGGRELYRCFQYSSFRTRRVFNPSAIRRAPVDLRPE